jgi:hypothetical protein
MNIELLPFSAFALEASGAPARAISDAQTLTLQLGLAPAHTAFEPAMSGSISVGTAVAASGSLRAQVLPANGAVLTITF